MRRTFLTMAVATILCGPVPARGEATICTAPGTQDQIAVARGDSSAVVVWRDNRNDATGNPYDIFASRRNYFLNPVWSSLADGADECTAAGAQIEPAVTVGPDGITWMSWRDYRTCTAGQVLVQAIAPDGSPLCSVNGTTIASAGCDDGMRSHTIISTSPGSAIVIWHHKYDTGIGGETYDEILAQKLSTSACARQWGSNGVVIKNHGFGSASGTSVLVPYAVADGSGGVLVVWFYANRLYARRVDSSGNVLWSGPVRVCTTEVTQQNPSLAPDGSGGIIVTWQQGNIGSRTILAQRIDASGVLQWGNGGKVVAGSGGDLTNPQIVRSTLGRSFIIWEADYAPPNSDIFAQRINVFGDTLAARIPICTALYGQTAPRAAAGPGGSCYIVWQDGRGAIGEDDVFAQELDASGNILGDANGCSFAGVPGSDDGTQSNPQIVSVEIGGSTTVPGAHALVVWNDNRNGTLDIYACPMSDPCHPGVLAVGPRTADARIGITNLPNPFSRSTKIRFQLAQQSPVVLGVYDVNGRRIRALVSDANLGAGEHEVEWDGMTDVGSRATPGLYFSRLTTGMHTRASSVILLK